MLIDMTNKLSQQTMKQWRGSQESSIVNLELYIVTHAFNY